MQRDDTTTANSVETSGELLRGLAAIARFLGVNSRTAGHLIKRGLPTARLGLPVATTKRLALEWFESQCGKGR
jgi:hypothetical protein